jgi:hypothetical protein
MASLKVHRVEAQHRLEVHRTEGLQLLDKVELVGTDQDAYIEWDEERVRWVNRTTDALRSIYEGDEEAKEFRIATSAGPRFVGARWPERYESQYLGIKQGLNTLLSLAERLQYAEEPAPLSPAQPGDPVLFPRGEPVIFLVHGHDHDSRDKVRTFLERAGDHKHEIVILDDAASKGQTVVEKLEEHASTSQYAVVLLTGDDIGGETGSMLDELHPRARQNVILELGWFCGEIGRKHVAVLYEDGVELPSDIAGLVYISLAQDWEKRLARELKAADFDFSLDRL